MTKTQEKTKQLLADLKEQVSKFDDKEFRNALDFIAHNFHRFSFHNTMLIHMQKPLATLCKGFKQWKKLNRFVRKGEKGLAILFPTVRTFKEEDPKTGAEVEKAVTLFYVGHVFDISQTEGEEIPELEALKIGVPENTDAEPFFKVLSDAVGRLNLALETDNTGQAGGWTDGEKVVVNSDSNHATSVNTVFHELGHALLHFGEDRATLSKELKELEAESVAYVVAQHFGLHTDSVSYLGSWTKTVDLMESLERIHKTAEKIIDAFQEEMEQAEAKTA
jgi:antirestriction protein ArdC